MSRLNSQQYSDIGQSLRQMPPMNPPLPKDKLNYLRKSSTQQDPPRISTRATQRLPTLLRGSSVRKLSMNMGRKKCKSGGGNRDSSSSSSRSLSAETGHSCRASVQSSLSEDSFDQQYELPMNNAHHLTSLHDEFNNFNCRGGVLDAVVSRNNSSRDDLTFDYDYAARHTMRPTFDFDYTAQHGDCINKHPPSREQPQALPTLQQHLEKKRSYSRDSGPGFMNHDNEGLKEDGSTSVQDSDQNDQKPQTPSLVAKMPSETGVSQRSSIDIIDPTLIDDIIQGAQKRGQNLSTSMREMGLRGKSQKPLPDWVDDISSAHPENIDPDQKPQTPSMAAKMPSENDASRRSSIDIIDPTLIDDIIQGAQKGGQKLSTSMREMGLRGKSQAPLPDWVDDIFSTHPENIDPDVLKELILATVGDVRSMDGAESSGLEHDTDPDNDSKPQAVQQEKPATDNTKSVVVDQKQPLERHQNYEIEKKKRPSAVAHDTRGPIPPANSIFGSSFAPVTEPEPVSEVIEDTHGPIFTPVTEPEPVSEVIEDTHGPIPNDDFMYCNISLASEKKEKSVSSKSRKNEKGVSTVSSSNDTNIKSEAGNMSRKYVMDGSIGSSSCGSKKDNNSGCVSERCIKEGSLLGNSRLGSKKDSDMNSVLRKSIHSASHDGIKKESETSSSLSTLSTSKISSSSCSCSCSCRQRKSPPATNLSQQSTLQSPQNHSYCTRTGSTMEYPSDEEPSRGMPPSPPLYRLPPPPLLRRMSSSTSFSSFDEDDHNLNMPHHPHTKPSLGFLSWHSHHVNSCRGSDDDIQASITEMRQLVLDSMQARQEGEMRKRPSKCLYPINI